MEGADQTRTQKLIQRLQHPDPVVRLHAGVVLGGMGPSAAEAVPALAALLGAEAAQDRKMAALTLGYIGPAAAVAVPALTQALDDSDPVVGQMARLALSRVGLTPGETRVA
jgi:HEAT repeat protein